MPADQAPLAATNAPDADDAKAVRPLRFRPLHRTLLTIFTGLLCGSLVVASAIALAARPGDEIGELQKHVAVAESALTEYHEALAQGSDETRLAFASPDVEARNQLISTAAASNARAGRAWERFKGVSLNLPGEQALRDLNDKNELAQTQGTVGFLNVPPSDLVAAAAIGVQVTQWNRERLVPIQQIRELYSARAATLLKSASGSIGDFPLQLLLIFVLLSVIWVPVIYVTMRGASKEERWLRSALRERQESTRHAEFDSEIQRALEMARDENGSFEVVTLAMRGAIGPSELGEFLVADSSRAHFRQVSGTLPGGDGPGCAVGSPADCPATKSGQALVFPSSARLDACPYLRNREIGQCSAVCVPVAIAGRTIGVLHVTALPEAPPDQATVQDLEVVARKAGDRIGMLRAFARSEEEARTDPLTGLLNRRSLENRVRRLTAGDVPYVVAFADLDNFKDLNTAHGHEAGDRALRIFSRTLRDSIRPDDIAARWGGEEFVTVLPECTVEDAQVVAERLRERLRWVLDQGDVPGFTVSIGLASSEPGASFNEVVAGADEALLLAKAAGRDRVLVLEPSSGLLFAGSLVPLPVRTPEIPTAS